MGIMYDLYDRPIVLKVGDKFVNTDMNPRYVDLSTILVENREDSFKFNGYSHAYNYKLKLIDFIDESNMWIEPYCPLNKH